MPRSVDSRERLALLRPAIATGAFEAASVAGGPRHRAGAAAGRSSALPGWTPEEPSPVSGRPPPGPPAGARRHGHHRAAADDGHDQPGTPDPARTDDIDEVDDVEGAGPSRDHDGDDLDGDDGHGDDGDVGGGDGDAGYAVRRERSGPWGRLAERWVPEPLRDSRLDPARRGALVLSLIAAVAAVAAAIGVWRDRPEPRPVENVGLQTVVSPSAVAVQETLRAAVAATTTGTGSAAVVVVSVTGAVKHPGLVRLPAGSRVADAIAAAGGMTDQADPTGLNLAERLTDGRSVVVPAKGQPAPAPPAGGTPPASSSGPVNLNTADLAALDALPGVGPSTASNILAWRDKNGTFVSVEQLQEVPGIGPAKYAQLAPLVTV